MKNNGTLNGSCSFGLPARIFPQAISPTHSASSFLPQEERWQKRGGLKNRLKSYKIEIEP
jgi:hypothetical protein